MMFMGSSSWAGMIYMVFFGDSFLGGFGYGDVLSGCFLFLLLLCVCVCVCGGV